MDQCKSWCGYMSHQMQTGFYNPLRQNPRPVELPPPPQKYINQHVQNEYYSHISEQI